MRQSAHKKSSEPLRKLTRVEMATFLRRLAAFYDNPRLGNISLAESLYDLADSVVSRGYHSPELPLHPEDHHRGHIDFRNFDAEAVARFIEDDSRPKSELIDLAVSRFSIPRSGLMRMKVSDVREAIRTALLHENSISIIAQEARRSGADRKS